MEEKEKNLQEARKKIQVLESDIAEKDAEVNLFVSNFFVNLFQVCYENSFIISNGYETQQCHTFIMW